MEKINKSWKTTISYIRSNHRLGRETVVVQAGDIEQAHANALKLAKDAKLNEPRVVTCVEY